jgi:hypothetical protein
MLADGCEAALRSLPPDTSDEQARDTVRRLVGARQRDGQLRKSSLSRSEVELVIRAFVQVWRRMRHRRIPLPDSGPSRISRPNAEAKGRRTTGAAACPVNGWQKLKAMACK